MPEEPKIIHNFFLYSILLSCFLVVGYSFYSFYLQKDFNFIVEVYCDPNEKTCFKRDCSDLKMCPPNGLIVFNRYTIKASDFSMCKDEDCYRSCEDGIIDCKPIGCSANEEMGESCVSPQKYTAN